MKKLDSLKMSGLVPVIEQSKNGAYSTKPTYSVDGGNSFAGNSPRNKKEGISPDARIRLGSGFEAKDLKEESVKKEETSPKQEPAAQPHHIHSSPTKRDGDIEELQSRKIQLDDFL